MCVEDNGGAYESEPPTIEFNASVFSSIVISVVRDRAISSVYGFYLAILREEGQFSAPPLEDIFSNGVANKLRLDMQKICKDSDSVILYSDAGDLFGQLSRLLIACNERLAKEVDILARADEKIDAMGFDCWADKDSYIRHLRNAILHGHFSVTVDECNPLKTVFHFWDINNRGLRTAEFNFTAEELNQVIDILIDDVCMCYLKRIDWEIA